MTSTAKDLAHFEDSLYDFYDRSLSPSSFDGSEIHFWATRLLADARRSLLTRQNYDRWRRPDVLSDEDRQKLIKASAPLGRLWRYFDTQTEPLHNVGIDLMLKFGSEVVGNYSHIARRDLPPDLLILTDLLEAVPLLENTYDGKHSSYSDELTTLRKLTDDLVNSAAMINDTTKLRWVCGEVGDAKARRVAAHVEKNLNIFMGGGDSPLSDDEDYLVWPKIDAAIAAVEAGVDTPEQTIKTQAARIQKLEAQVETLQSIIDRLHNKRR